MTRKLLMIPGPSEAYPEVVAELAKPVLPHYGEDFGPIYTETCEKTKSLFGTRQSVILLPGPGAAALEMAVVNLAGPGDKALVCVNGWFSDLFRDIAERYGATVLVEKADYGKVVPAERVRRRMEKEKDVRAVFVVQNDTSTGVRHPLKEIGAAVREHGAFFAVDAVSLFGGGEVLADDWNIDVCIGYPSKALGGINGIVPVMIGERTWKAVAERTQPIRARYLDLQLWAKHIKEWASWGHPFPTSQPASLVVALHKAVEMALAEGLEARYRRHDLAGKAVRAAVRALGLELLAEEDVASPTVTVVIFPKGFDADALRATLFRRYSIMVAGLGAFIPKSGIRIGHMGVTASPQCVLPTIAALEGALAEHGMKVTVGAGVTAAQRVFQAG
jgi:aspartate aminotransferase-like enzyme